ncbi:hypothetical protein GVN16_18135 [Emticicia sp. CRIBPO]|uniref:hypothetical protein n=1 Tax=Emticicia sp. CRIBPO TaxID=2683258 RepID=UPI0014132B66|nr:hypothetical protein [Emticicia sp. CRIBPO]NBA87695.1 hypothetical protein [Emticicia sp. CRIBPO]
MEINIKKGDQVSTLQKSFREAFPYLKLKFYKIPHQHDEGSEDTLIWPAATMIDGIRTKYTLDTISIEPQHTAGEVEKAFYDIFGLNVQLFRQAGGIWIQTIKTDDWTLEKLNEAGEQTTIETVEEEKDYGLMDDD